MTRKHILTLFIFIFLLAACGGGAKSAESTNGRYGLADTGSSAAGDNFYADNPQTAPLADGIGADYANNSPTSYNQAQDIDQTQLPQSQDRLIIRTGNMEVVVEDTETSLAEIGRLAEQVGGWIVTSEVRQSGDSARYGDAKYANITLRIPAESYDEMVNRVKEMSLEVTTESTSSQDVTEEYVDLTSRLGNLEATADRVRAFLDEANNVEDALAVNHELSSLEEQIEVIKGRMQYLSQSAAFSTLTVYLTPDVLSQPIEVAGWRPEGTAKNAIEALIRTVQIIADVAIVAGLYILPLILLFGVPGFLIIKFGRRWLRSRRQETAVEAIEAAE